MQEFANRVGVSFATVSRWRSGQTAVSESFWPALFSELGFRNVEEAQAAAARDMKLPVVTFPVIRTRGAVRTHGAARTRGAISLPTARRSVTSVGRVFALLFHGGCPAPFAWLQSVLDEQRDVFADWLGRPAEEDEKEGRKYRFGSQETVVMAPAAPTQELVLDLLAGVRMTADSNDLFIVFIRGVLQRDGNDVRLVLEDENSTISLNVLIERLAKSAARPLLIIEAIWPDRDGAYPKSPQLPLEDEWPLLFRAALPVIVAALPPRKQQAEGWPYFSETIQEGLTTGAADLSQDGVISIGEFCRYATSRIRPRNNRALVERAAGKTTTIVPTPRLTSTQSDGERLLAIRVEVGDD